MKKYSSLGMSTAVLFAALPFATSRELFFGAVNAKFFTLIGGVLLLSALALVHLYRDREGSFFEKRPFAWILAGLVIVYWVSALQGVFFERSVFSDIPRSSGVFFLTHIAALAYILGRLLTSVDWRLLMRTTAVSAGLVSLCTIFGREGLGLSGKLFWMNFDISGFTFGNSTFAGTYLVLALVVTLVQLSKEREPRWRRVIAGAGLAIFLSPVLFNTGLILSWSSVGTVFTSPELLLGSARASSAAAVAMILFYSGYLLLKKYASTFPYITFAWSGLFLGGVLVSVALLFMPGSIVQEKYIESSTAARIIVWDGGLQAFKDRPLLGWGVENYEQAFQKYFDNRLYQSEYLGEIWFDRAHNGIVDTLVSVGMVGFLMHIALGLMFVLVVYRSYRKGIIQEEETVLWGALPLVHFLQLQTGFDTIGSYALLAVVAGYGLHLERVVGERHTLVNSVRLRVVGKQAGIVIAALLWVTSSYFLWAEFSRQQALYLFFVEGKLSEKLVSAEVATSRTSSFESLRRAELAFIQGTLGNVGNRSKDQKYVQGVQKQLTEFENQYREYLETEPYHYRARMNYAYLLLVKTALGEDRTKDARQVLQDSYELSPRNPLAYVLAAYVALYENDLKDAEKLVQSAYMLNQNIPFTQDAVKDIELQKRQAPKISVPNMVNLL